MKHYIDLDKELEQLIKYVKEGKMRVESISCIPNLQPRYITDDILEYYEYIITIRQEKEVS